MADQERVYNVPLRKEWLKAPRYRRTKKAVSAMRNFLKKHMKSADIRIGKHLNQKLWQHGIKNPPHHVKVNAVKDNKGAVRAELVGFKYEEFKKEKKEEKGKIAQAIDKLTGKKAEKPEIKEEKEKKEKPEKKKTKKEKPKEVKVEETEKKEPPKEEKEIEKTESKHMNKSTAPSLIKK